jgi:phosphatidylglycerophosphate synthase
MDYLLADMITPPLYAIGIDTPNKVTFLNCAVVRAMSVYLLLFGGIPGYWAQIILLPIHQILDCADGQMARRYGLGSEFGAWLDHFTDNVYGLFFSLSMVYKISLVHGAWSMPFNLALSTLVIMCFFGNQGVEAKEAGTHYSKMTMLQKIGMHQELYMTYIYISIMTVFITMGWLQ